MDYSTVELSPNLLRYFAADPVGVLYTVPRVVRETSNPFFQEIGELLARISQPLIDEVLTDENFLFFHERRSSSELETDARVEVLVRVLNAQIPTLRLSALLDSSDRPEPYREAAITDLAVDDQKLVAMREFKLDGSLLERRGGAFMMTPSVASPNAAYWFLRQVEKHDLIKSVKVRLDPFMHGAVDKVPNMFYKMWLYGRPLDWDRLGNLEQPDTGRWMPDVHVDGMPITDFVWDRRGNEVHFRCEEVPPLSQVELSGGRYFHAIYRPDRKEIVHVDGALRIFERDELLARQKQHVQDAGKAGRRIKLFRIDDPISRECLADLAVAFLVWNDDISRYFGPVRHARGSALESPTN
jgi:hypothetical protein